MKIQVITKRDDLTIVLEAKLKAKKAKKIKRNKCLNEINYLICYLLCRQRRSASYETV